MPTARPKGLRPFTPRDTDIEVGKVFSATGQLAKEGGTHYTTGLGLLGNGTWGDCYWAAAGRIVHSDSRIGGRNRPVDEPHTVATYEGYIGKKLTRQTDQGTDAREGAKYLIDHGFLDANGATAHIGAYGFESDPEKVPALVNALGSGIVCVELTQECEEEFNAAEEEGRPFVWDTKLGHTVAGGHAIPTTYWTPDGLGVNSWDREGVITWDYLAKYMQTTVAYFSAAILSPTGASPLGLNKQALLTLLHEVTSD